MIFCASCENCLFFVADNYPKEAASLSIFLSCTHILKGGSECTSHYMIKSIVHALQNYSDLRHEAVSGDCDVQ